MILYLVRHGIAEDHGTRASDAERRLAAEGKVRTREVMQNLAQMNYPAPDLVITSPYIRADETARIVIEEFCPGAALVTSTALLPMGDMVDTMTLVEEKLKTHRSVMLVGHEPHLSLFGSALLGVSQPAVEMKKSAVALFELHRIETPRMRGVLTALFPPRIGQL